MNVPNEYEPVILRKRQPKASELRSQQAVNAAQRSGQAVDTQKKWSGGQNKQFSANKNTLKLDQETDELKHDKVSLDVGKLIQQGRQAKEWTQKDLAQRINEKPQVVNDYESGRAIPNQQILSKLERQLGIHLRGQHKGDPITTKKK